MSQFRAHELIFFATMILFDRERIEMQHQKILNVITIVDNAKPLTREILLAGKELTNEIVSKQSFVTESQYFGTLSSVLATLTSVVLNDVESGGSIV